MAENAIEGISVLVEKFVKHSEDETYYYQLQKIVQHIFHILDPKQTEIIRHQSILIVNLLILTQSRVLSDKFEAYMAYLLIKPPQEESSLQIRWRIVQGITNIMDHRTDIILANFSAVSDVMNAALKEKD